MAVFCEKQKDTPSSLISIFSTYCLLHRGCIRYLAYVYDIRTCEVSLEDILVAKDYPDVFLDKLPSLPLEK